MLLPIIAALMPIATASAPPGKETVISFAGNGGLRDWAFGPTRDVLLVRIGPNGGTASLRPAPARGSAISTR